MFQRGFKTWCENVSKQYRKNFSILPADPLNAFKLAESLKITVSYANQIPDLDPNSLRILIEEDSSSWSAATLSVNSEYLIILNPTHSKARTSSNLMHELAHIIIGHEPARVDVTEDNILLLNTYDQNQEEQADWLCGCLLLPREALLKIKRNRIIDSKASELYGVSADMLKYRMNITGVNNQLKRVR